MFQTACNLFLAVIALQLDPFIDFLLFGVFGMVGLIFVAFFVIFIAIIVAVAWNACKATRSQSRLYDATKVPVSRPHSRQYIRETLPIECPECDAPLKYNEVKWVGPRRAECPYCGNVVELQEQEVTETG
jgi:hypothetical protein